MAQERLRAGRAPLVVALALGLLVPGTTLAAVEVNFDFFPGPDGVLGTTDDIPVAAGQEFTDQYEIVGLIIENAVASTGMPGLYALPQGPLGSTTHDIIPTTPPNAAAPLEIPGDLEASSTGFILFRFFPTASDFCLDMLDIEGSGDPGTQNSYIDVNFTDGAGPHLLVPSGPTGNQQRICYAAPAGKEIMNIFVSINDGVPSGESGAVDSLSFTQTGGCWLTSGGHLKASAFTSGNRNGGSDKGGKSLHSFGGNVGPPPAGSWEHVAHALGLNFHSNDAHITECFNDGGPGPGNPKANVNVARFEGTGRLRDNVTGDVYDNVPFTAEIIDRGEPGKSDVYTIMVDGPGGYDIIVDHVKVSGGNLQIHPPNPSLSK